MVVYIVLVAVYVCALLYIKPEPESLKSQPLTLTQNYKQIRVSLYGGILLLTIFLFTSNFDFEVIDDSIFQALALSNVWELAHRWPYQIFTHHLIHINDIHVISNVFLLMFLTAYERRVGSRRFLEVAIASALFSTPSVFLVSEDVATCGISAALFGLGAAYFTDKKQLSVLEWLKAIGLFSLIAVLLTLAGEIESVEDELDMVVDQWGHALGAVGGILYCRFRQLKTKKEEAKVPKKEEVKRPESKRTDLVSTAIDKLRYSGNTAAADRLVNAQIGGATGGEIIHRIGMFFIELNKNDQVVFAIVKEEATLFFKQYAEYFSSENPEGRDSVKLH